MSTQKVTTLPIIDTHPPEAEAMEVSFVMPCLNEARTIEACIRAARACLREHGLTGEIVIGDNGSTDGSPEIAARAGARVIPVTQRGYGAALAGAIDAARGEFIVMGDADESYDFAEAFALIERLRAGADLVMGNRFRGSIRPGAMPWHHRFIGNPLLSTLGRVLFRSPVGDFHCGLRAFRKNAYQRMDLRTTGMEFASEMVVKAQLRAMRVEEVPVTLRKDGRDRAPHLRSFRDGWRHLRFMLTLSPRWTMFVPGLALFVLGAALMLLTVFAPLRIGAVTLDLHTLVAGSMAVVVGYQFMLGAIAVRSYALEAEIGPAGTGLRRLIACWTFERGLIAGALAALVGLGFMLYPTMLWFARGLGEMKVESTLRPMIAGATLVALGAQTMLMGVVISMFSIRTRRLK